ncbi:MAG: 30S ribosomal protein S2 [Kiritimatiellae bacterium]|jgi:small subunit ribosomal protein S2|nr:30S ribosomal protein S2 [Kiritimatiellia bacterium]
MEMPTSALTGITLKDMFDAGLHFGHQTKRWNPKMKGYIFDKRNGIHIIDLQQSVELLDEAAAFVRDVVLGGKKILFVATKRQMAELVKSVAIESDQYYVTERWLGGTLTNAKTIRSSVKRMHQLQATAKANGGELSEHKQENSMLRRELSKLEKNLSGIADMIAEPGCVFIVDCVKEANAVKEATRLGIPVVAIVDTNADPEPIDYVVPANDDSVNGVKLILEGLTKVIKTANDEYSAKAAEENRKRESERKSREEAEKAARAERKARAGAKSSGERRSSSKKGIGADVKAAARAAKEAAETKAKADLAAKRKAAVAEAEAAVAAAAEAPAVEAPAAEAPAAE